MYCKLNSLNSRGFVIPNEALVYSVAVTNDTYFKLSHLNSSRLCLVKPAADYLTVIKEVFIWQ